MTTGSDEQRPAPLTDAFVRCETCNWQLADDIDNAIILLTEHRTFEHSPAPESLSVGTDLPCRHCGHVESWHYLASTPDWPRYTATEIDVQRAFLRRICQKCGFRFDDALHDHEESLMFDHKFVESPSPPAPVGTDSARAEAERRYPENEPAYFNRGMVTHEVRDQREAFEDGAAWAEERKARDE